MNEKTAKRLRKVALGLVVAAEEQKPELKIQRVIYKTTKSGTRVVTQSSYRGAYLALKRKLDAELLTAKTQRDFSAQIAQEAKAARGCARRLKDHQARLQNSGSAT